jgi:phosphoglycolate phosphatase-like HAD superfamily hydrolase
MSPPWCVIWAHAHGVSFTASPLDAFTAAASRLSDAEVRPDETEDLLVALAPASSPAPPEWKHVHKLPYPAALTRELERPGKALDQFLALFVRLGAISLSAAADRLSHNSGLGPPADVALGVQEEFVASPSPLPQPDPAAGNDERPAPFRGPRP